MKVVRRGDTAIVNYRSVVTLKEQTIDAHRRYRTTNVWMNRDGRWEIVAAHTAFVLEPTGGHAHRRRPVVAAIEKLHQQDIAATGGEPKQVGDTVLALLKKLPDGSKNVFRGMGT